MSRCHLAKPTNKAEILNVPACFKNFFANSFTKPPPPTSSPLIRERDALRVAMAQHITTSNGGDTAVPETPS
ncbi:uncharacterized protein LTR77_008182 [Saxophila tyrrhenica]|uniref:Uncharacterized protein n=1 Tax=Saxophila tyrrhenica TaxID=1690608 RepID=A0AAV9P225_9PEZI|nr:hypothetical protein LTR77_008182 [Saxophila tyrrhenica]